jgi:hypothetical protein
MHWRNAARQRWVIDCAVVLEALHESNLLMPSSRIMRDFCKSVTFQCSLSLQNKRNCQLLLFQTVRSQVLYLELGSGNLFFGIPSVSCVCIFRTGNWNQDIRSKPNMPFRRLEDVFHDEEHLLSCRYDGIHACIYLLQPSVSLETEGLCSERTREAVLYLRRQSCVLTRRISKSEKGASQALLQNT